MAEAEARFKLIAEAFETLSDEATRAAYDSAGAAPQHAPDGRGGYAPPYGAQQGFYAPMHHSVDPFELFNAFFGGGRGGDPFAAFGMPVRLARRWLLRMWLAVRVLR